MKGLLKKDLYMTWAYSKIFLLMSLIFVAVSVLSQASLFFIFYPLLMAGILPVSLLSYDERFRWNVYCDATPLTRRQQVTEKYLLTLLYSVGMLLLLALIHGIRLISQGQTGEFLEMLSFMVILALVSPALMLPLLFRLGPERGRLAYFGLFAVLLLFVTMLTGKSMADIPATSGPLGFLLATLAVSVLLFLGSWWLSMRWYDKREF